MTVVEKITLLKTRIFDSGQLTVEREAIMDDWIAKGESARNIYIALSTRVLCPSCDMNGIAFFSCDYCGAPACDNCMNKSGCIKCSCCCGP